MKPSLASGFATTLAVIALSASAKASLVLHMPLNDASSGGVTTAAAPINSAAHPTTSGTSAGTTDLWVNDPTRGNVYYSAQASRLNAGTQGIDRAAGFTWSMWVKLDPTAPGNSDAGADVIIGTRQNSNGQWHKVQRTSVENWAGIANYGGADLMTSTWRQMTYVGDSTSIRMYIDGVQVGSPDTTTPTATYNGNFEIGGSGTFSEDSEGLFSDLGVWNEALTANEITGLFDISRAGSGYLAYNVAEFDTLKQVHDAGSGSATIDGLEWYYASGLAGSAGLSGSNGNYTLILNSTNGTGLVTVIPEPSAALLGVIGAFLFLRRSRHARIVP